MKKLLISFTASLFVFFLITKAEAGKDVHVIKINLEKSIKLEQTSSAFSNGLPLNIKLETIVGLNKKIIPTTADFPSEEEMRVQVKAEYCHKGYSDWQVDPYSKPSFNIVEGLEPLYPLEASTIIIFYGTYDMDFLSCD